ncbi:F-box protein SKIP23 [Apium graveolens]|uniref:F-box protein SKIP23 n=1 Tax=Apium graveolens TaxID=4045 RepID=UPI003D7B2BC9
MAEWCNLPRELLDLISKHLDSSIDLLRFRSVCTSWRSSLHPHNPSPPSRFPILPNNGISETTWGFYLFKRSIFFIQLPPTLFNSQQFPSWVIKIDQDNPQKCHLFNPLSRDEYKPLPFDFPRVLDFLGLRVCELGKEFTLQYINYRPFATSIGDAGSLYSEKVAFCDVGCGGGYVILTIHVSGRLALLKSGDLKWTVVEDMPSPYDDVIFYKGCFYAVDSTGRSVIVDVGSERVTVKFVADSVFGGDTKMLVDGCGELFMVDKFLSVGAEDDEGIDGDEEFDCYMSERTVRFEVFKLDKSGEKWIKVENLGDRIIFLGDNCAFSGLASDFVGCKGNCILFTNSNKVEDGVLKSRGISVFDLESGNIGPLGNYPGLSELFWPPPAWISSSPPNPVEAGLDHLRI